MTDLERDVAADVGESDVDAEQTDQRGPTGPRWKRVLKWAAIGVGGTLGAVALAAYLLYNFGGMSGSVYPELGPQYEQLVASGQVAPVQRRFVIPIPGCRCHSTDPVLTAQHSRRRMNECGKCHNTRPAHMEPGMS